MKTLNETHFIHIRSEITQFDEPEKLELMTRGSFLRKNGNYYISYSDTEATGHAGCTTTIKIAEDTKKVSILRFGKHTSQLHLERGERNICHYETDMGSLTLGITTDEISSNLTEDGGNLKLSYLVDFGSAQAITRNELDVTVTAFES